MDLQKHAQQPDPAPRSTELRASDADRDRIAELLHEAHAEGRLTADEHAERVEGVLSAKTLGELEGFIQDLPAAHRRHAAPVSAPGRPAAGVFPVDPDDNVVAVFSAAARKGRWRTGRRIHAYAVFGSVEIDLSEALFDHQQVMIKAFSVFGSVEIRVPENVSLRGTGGGVLGAFEVVPQDSPDDNAPVVYVDGWAVLGSVEARPKRGKLVKDILDRVQRTVDRSMRKHLGH
ncbi:hypothetical protein C1708_11870 [Streptomyces sp. DH-12]|uniref:DUF1707 SHOCT-like domain-containing protein n=1 Tax=Streptomyces sp. DH-12 TaxID=2072509 RepID=UPI000CCDD435|nr:DUF1707 domain-containing protein [Streptomyces sp. DH-12]PNV32936.1 hypothetical protein C1708_11870 [Streptomyces sp. DH-12]